MDSAASLAKLAGWHGKLPTVGDFATRRLDPNFVSVWDEWLSRGIDKLRTEDESRWLDAYLASPTWRFLFAPGFLPAPLQRQAWAGIVMPSMDRVGRYYPLTIAMPLAEPPADSPAQAALWTWLHRIDDAAVDALQDDWSIEALEEELLRIGAPAHHATDLKASAGETAPAFAGQFFSAINSAPGSADGQTVCSWRSEAGLLPAREFQSKGLDDSILTLWRA